MCLGRLLRRRGKEHHDSDAYSTNTILQLGTHTTP